MRMWDGKRYVPEKEPQYIYQGTTKNGDIISFPTEAQTISELEKAGGGIYRNILHGFQFSVAGETK